MLNSEETAAVHPSRIQLSATVTFLIQDFLNQGPGSFTLWGLEYMEHDDEWKKSWMEEWLLWVNLNLKTGGMQLFSKAITIWSDYVLTCDLSAWSFKAGLAVSWESRWYIVDIVFWALDVNPPDSWYTSTTNHASLKWAGQARCSLLSCMPVCFGEAASHSSIAPLVSLFHPFPSSLRLPMFYL